MRTPPDNDNQEPHPTTQKIDHSGHDMHEMQGMHIGHGGHPGMLIACCIPMLVIAGALVATGVVGLGFLVFAAVCTAMMAMMMRGMNHSGSS